MSAISQDNITTEAWFQQLFQTYRQGLNGQSAHPLAQFRLAAYEQLAEQTFPTRRDEDWKYSGAPVARLLETRFQQAGTVSIDLDTLQQYRVPELDAAVFVFVNGQLQDELSDWDKVPTGLTVQKLANALEDDTTRQWIEEQVANPGGTARNTFLPLNRAFAENGLYIASESNAIVERPVHLLFLNTDDEDAHVSHPQLFVNAATSSQFSYLETYQASENAAAYFTNTANYVYVAANANVHHYKLQTEGEQALQINNTLVKQERDSVYSHYALDLGGKVVRNNLSTELLNSNTNTNYYGAYLGSGQQHIDNQTFLDHAVPHCESNELYKGILDDYSRGVFNGKVLVRQDAQKTNAYQQNASLVLSKNAIMDAKPQLEIYADDVRCSHGATIGQLDEGSVFYLRSRGIPEPQARQLLQQAFIGEVIEAMPNNTIREWALELVHQKMNK